MEYIEIPYLDTREQREKAVSEVTKKIEDLGKVMRIVVTPKEAYLGIFYSDKPAQQPMPDLSALASLVPGLLGGRK